MAIVQTDHCDSLMFLCNSHMTCQYDILRDYIHTEFT